MGNREDVDFDDLNDSDTDSDDIDNIEEDDPDTDDSDINDVDEDNSDADGGDVEEDDPGTDDSDVDDIDKDDSDIDDTDKYILEVIYELLTFNPFFNLYPNSSPFRLKILITPSLFTSIHIIGKSFILP